MRFLRSFCILFVFVFVFSQIVSAQNSTQQSYEKAREIFDKTVAAYGGIKNLEGIEKFSFRVEGDSVHRNQSRKTFMSERTPYRAKIVIDVKNSRYRQEQESQFPGGFRNRGGFSIEGTGGVSFDFVRQTINRFQNIVTPSNFRPRLRWMPQFVILEANNSPANLRYLGKAVFENRQHDLISFSTDTGQVTTLYLDEKTNLLSKFETLGTDVFAGDVIIETIFTGYKDINNHKVPLGRIIKVAGEMTGELRYEDAVFNGNIAEDAFKEPAGLREPTAVTPPPSTKYSDSVYTVNAGGYNVLAVGFKDFVFIMEAPRNDATSRQVIAEVKKLFPEKPVRYVAVTHHHDDHAGGIRTYIAEDAAIVGAPGEKSFFEKVTKSVFTIAPDSLARNPKSLKFEALQNGKRVITDGTQTVEIYDIGAGPHTEEMLVAYLPNEKIVFQGDLVNNPANGDRVIANETTAHFAKWLETTKLAVDRIVPVHGTPQTMDGLRQAVTEMTTAKK